MFDQYKSLMGKKQQESKEESMISRSLNFLLRPYKVLFQSSGKKPKEVGVKAKEEIVEKQTNTSIVVKPAKSRAGKVLWKKRR